MVVVVKGSIPKGPMTGTVTYLVLDQGKNAVVGQIVLPNASDPPMNVDMAIQVPPSAGPFAIGHFEQSGDFKPASGLAVTRQMGS